MGLGLQEADASIQLGGHRDILVVLGKVADEGGVMGSDCSDVRVLTAAKFSVPITEGLCLSWSKAGKREQEEGDKERMHGEAKEDSRYII